MKAKTSKQWQNHICWKKMKEQPIWKWFGWVLLAHSKRGLMKKQSMLRYTSENTVLIVLLVMCYLTLNTLLVLMNCQKGHLDFIAYILGIDFRIKKRTPNEVVIWWWYEQETQCWVVLQTSYLIFIEISTSLTIQKKQKNKKTQTHTIWIHALLYIKILRWS